MPLISKNIEKIYAGKVAKEYDRISQGLASRWKRLALNDSSMKEGDKVLVFCCGTGLDFPHILKKIGKEGEIVGVDFSYEMLNQAKDKVQINKWENIELVEADVIKFREKSERTFDVGICTLGMSIIPKYQSAYYNLVSNVKKRGEIIISDFQLASGWRACFNPFTIFITKKFGATYEGHQNSRELYSLMKKELTEVRKKEFLLKSYFYCIGKTK